MVEVISDSSSGGVENRGKHFFQKSCEGFTIFEWDQIDAKRYDKQKTIFQEVSNWFHGEKALTVEDQWIILIVNAKISFFYKLTFFLLHIYWFLSRRL